MVAAVATAYAGIRASTHAAQDALLALHDVGLSHREIAAATGLSTKVVTTSITAARHRATQAPG